MLGASVVVAAAALALWMVKQNRGLWRLYWAGCCLLIGTGLLGLAAVLVFPPEYFDENGHLLGEMPPEFGIALAVLVLGLAGASVGAGMYYYRWRRRKKG